MKKQQNDTISMLNKQLLKIYNSLVFHKLRLILGISALYSKIVGTNNPMIQLMRIDKPIPYLLGVMPAWWVVAFYGQNTVQISILFIFFLIGAIVMRSAGCIINDIIDRDIDRLVDRTKNRPLVTGAIKLKQAMIALLILLSIGCIMLLALSKAAILIGVISIIPICLYPFMKRWMNFPQFFLGFVFNIGALIAWATIHDSLSWHAFIIYFASICWTVGYDTIYAYQDRNDDIKYNIKSSAVQLGEFGPSFIWSAYKLCIVTLCIAGLNAHMNLCFYLINAIASYSLYRQIENLDIHNPKNCQAIMNKNIEFGFWVLLAIFVGRI